MENLEEKTIEKLNNVLKSYNLIIRSMYSNPTSSSSYPTAINLFNFGLFKISDMYYSCLYCWNTFYDMVYSNKNIFNVCHEISFCKGDSLEEIIIKCDLIGI